MADEKYFYHVFVSPCFSPECPVLQGILWIRVVCSEITDCGESEQNPASCYYLLVVKLVVKWKMLLLRINTKTYLHPQSNCQQTFHSHKSSFA